MWSSFALALAVGAVFLYLPGYLALRAVRVSRTASVACAPVVGIAAYALVSVAYGMLGVSCSWQTVFLPVLACGLVAALASFAVERRSVGSWGLARGARAVLGGQGAKHDGLMLTLYFALGVVFVALVFVKGLDGSDSFVQEIDNAHHLNSVRSFLDSGVWSSLTSSLYLAEADSGVSPLPGASFYPSAWHDVVALIVNATGVTVTQGVNATNALFAGLVFPGSTFVLMRALFPERPVALVCGGLAVLAFAAFPWKMLYWGPIYPNLASLCVLPAVAWLFMETTGAMRPVAARVLAGLLFAVGGIALALLQPNAVFSAAVFLVPWCVHRAVEACGSSPRCERRRKLWQAVAGAGFVLFALAIWAVLYNLPALNSVVEHTWPATESFAQALVNVLTLSFRWTMAQVLLGVLVAVGFVIALRDGRLRWVAASYALTCTIYYVCVTIDGPIKHWLAGFWYTDPVRLAANAVIVAMPLAALGLAWAVEKAHGAIERHRAGWIARRPECALPVATVVVIATFAFVNFYPSFTLAGHGEINTAFGDTEKLVEDSYNASNVDIYAPQEEQFVDRVKEAIPADAVVLNQPNDGSVFAYGIDGVRVVYRQMRDYGGARETEGSKLIRERLDELANNVAVQDAVREMGATYLLQLDNPRYTDYPLGLQPNPIDPGRQRYENKPEDPQNSIRLDDYREAGGQDTYYNYFAYVPDEWAGIDAVNDETPGFDLVLSEGDMRLYRIVLDV